jgi:Mrp family chromosome partitioning ATPase
VAKERYRMLALKVEEQAEASHRKGFLVAVAAPNPGAGKTITSLNLGLTLARKGERRVLVIECDLWKPEFEGNLVFSDSPTTVADLLREAVKVPLSEAVVSLWGAGLDLLVGASTGGDGDLVTGKRMESLIQEARKTYDIVILDPPPFGLASGRSLARLADGVLVVVGAGVTKSGAIEELVRTVGAEKILGMVLNKAKARELDYSGYSKYAYPRGGARDRRGSEKGFLKRRKQRLYPSE